MDEMNEDSLGPRVMTAGAEAPRAVDVVRVPNPQGFAPPCRFCVTVSQPGGTDAFCSGLVIIVFR
jgi:hypothetical protein